MFDLDKMYCGAIRRGDVLIFESEEKIEKPIVVLQDNILNESLPTIICALIELYKDGEEVFPNEVLLKKEKTGLGKDGICMLHKILTVDRRLIIAKKGELSQQRLQEIYEAMDVNLGRFRD
ncbi:MAG: type II toxin-antitoxin system PemK/MazF family toxin [Parcubacteria group bacterium]|nr:type II toxin-antitoxin system PemK/MazF family toxin [Parcubacteria group bacterium]